MAYPPLDLPFADEVLFVKTVIDDDDIDILRGHVLIRESFQADQTIGRGAISELAAGPPTRALVMDGVKHDIHAYFNGSNSW